MAYPGGIDVRGSKRCCGCSCEVRAIGGSTACAASIAGRCRHVEAAVEAGLTPDSGEAPLTDVVIGVVCERVRLPGANNGAGWESLVPQEAVIKAWID